MVSCKPHEIIRTVNFVHFRHIDGFFPLVIDHITQFFRNILRIYVETFTNSPIPIISFIHLIGNAVICALPSDGHGFKKSDDRFPIFHLNFEFRHYAIKILLCNPSYRLLVRKVMRHVIVEPVGISDNDINHPFQIVEESG